MAAKTLRWLLCLLGQHPEPGLYGGNPGECWDSHGGGTWRTCPACQRRYRVRWVGDW